MRPALSDLPAYDDRLPLTGITVADFSWVLAGPRCTSWLGAMGARVIKVEGPRRPDQYRNVAIFEPEHAGIEGSGAFHNLNFSKIGCSIDFNHPKGLALARRIVGLSDVVIENFGYGVMERVGLGYEELVKVKPDIVMVQASAMGKTGPDKHHVAYGQLIHSFAGINSVTGYAGDDLGTLGGTYTDPLTANTAVFAILAALWHRRRTGQGQLIDLSMVEATMMQLPEAVMDYTANGRVGAPNGNLSGVAAPHDCYPCQDTDEWVAICVEDEDDWRAFCRALGAPAWTADPRFADQLSRFANREALDRLVGQWTRDRSAAAVTELLQAAGVAAGPSYTARQMFEDRHLHERGLYPEVDHPVVGHKPITGLPWRLEPGPTGQYWAAPTLGQHTDRVLHDILGIDEDEIASLRQEGVVL
jgi:benzylsuccinate CoA-transferase BbsF subunit